MIYYLSKKFTSCATNYNAIEKTCCTLVRALQNYGSTCFTTPRDLFPIWILLSTSLKTSSYRKDLLLANVALQINIVFMTRKAIKHQAIADYLVDQPLNDPKISKSLFPDEDVVALEVEPDNMELWRWKLYFDGAANSTENGVGVVLVSLRASKSLFQSS